MKLDFGSGYAPCPKWATLDCGANCTFNAIDEIPDNSIDKIRFRNVLHHIENLESLFNAMIPKFTNRIRITVIECRPEYFKSNVFLDNLWYRGITKRPDIYIANQYRDYAVTILNKGFEMIRSSTTDEKEIKIFKKIP